MKKILFVAAAALAITSCSQNEEIESQGANNEIKVGTVVKKSNRAADLTNGGFKSFTLSSFIVDASQDYATNGLGAAYMNGIAYTGGQNKWQTTDTGVYYWPTVKNVQFFGYSDGTFTAPATGYPTLEFTIPGTSALQKDVVVSATKMAKPADNGNATLAFKHILTKINFSYKPEAGGYEYSNIALKIIGVGGGKATYTFAADPALGTWSAGDAIAAEYEYPVTVGTLANDYYPLDSANGSLMLLPQALGNTAKIIASYTATKGAYTYTASNKEIDITKGTTWGVGKSIRYKLTLPAGDAKIVVDTEELLTWDTEAESTEN